ncbi:MAG TPA: hypothetical protein VOB72_13090 [Candidatus Dormibacteraeota bacterium]|nr:hypothetical protein [Candidatus Dormibacteraeota bacterium]
MSEHGRGLPMPRRPAGASWRLPALRAAEQPTGHGWRCWAYGAMLAEEGRE